MSALTSVDGSLEIQENTELASLSGLNSLESVGDELLISNCPELTNLNGLSALVSIDETLRVTDNSVLPDCNTCDLMDGFTNPPTLVDVYSNSDDECTPVPDNCP